MRTFFGGFMAIIGIAILMVGGFDAHPENLPGGLIVAAIGVKLLISSFKKDEAKPAGSSPSQTAAKIIKEPESQKNVHAPSDAPSAPPPCAPPSSAQKEQKVCKFCGHPYADGDTFCTECGAMDVE